jgi:membrane-bound metal-dependent hydrolase YbcI (DUF457 family)
MPLPVAHSLMGYTLAETTQVRLASTTWRNVLLFAALANLADIDFLPGFFMGQPNRYHHHLTHSFSFAAIVGLLGCLIYWRRNQKLMRHAQASQNEIRFRFWPYFLTISATVFSHCVLDLLTVDTSLPFGMLLFWPFDMGYYDMNIKIFESVHKSNASATFFASLLQWHNFKVMIIEVLIMVPLAGFVKIIRIIRRSLARQRSFAFAKMPAIKLDPLKAFSMPSRRNNQQAVEPTVRVRNENE